MTLIKSISGIRGTIGGKVGDNLTPVDAVKFASAYGTWLKNTNGKDDRNLKVVLGRDARISGPMIHNLVMNTLIGLGIDVIDLGLSTTPTVEVAVPLEGAQGGIILTASHNPKQWNALKLLNEKGEFVSGEEGKTILALAEQEDFIYAPVDAMGELIGDDNSLSKHIQAILDGNYAKNNPETNVYYKEELDKALKNVELTNFKLNEREELSCKITLKE